MDKNTIRTTMLSKRNALTKEFVKTSSNIIIEKLLTYTKNKINILIFMDMKNEVQVTKLLSHLKDSKINIFIPKIFPDGTMKINIYQKNELILN
ncbi:MAG: 5-formyltetrahydrofolate cyclo-ligase, partial [Leptotrichiaceae bacterium]